jgi:outer membrane protein OmpA-like peptidoglycan-associated protein
MRSFVLTSLVALLSMGCASKKYVSRQVGEVNDKVNVLSTSLERTQAAAERNEVRIDAVDREAQAGVSEAKGSARAALTKAEEAERMAKGKLLYSVTLSNDKVTFPHNRARLSDEAKQLVDETVGPIVAENRGVFLEIEGHTDATGPARYNHQLAEDRALAVRDYLRDQHQIALNRMEVISYGETKPVADNKTRDSRAQNRRVVINVLE